jgi:hypothetical protein
VTQRLLSQRRNDRQMQRAASMLYSLW